MESPVIDAGHRAALIALLRHLGGDVATNLAPTGTAGACLLLGSLGGLPAWAMHGSSMETIAAARRLARHGRIGVVLGCHAASERWFVAVSVSPVRLVAVCRGDRDALPLRRLAAAARIVRGSSLEQAIALAEAVDVDAAGRRTFRLLHQLLDRAVALLPRAVPVDDRHAWALAQLTRLLFLRFVEAEGWLDGNPRFLATVFDHCLAARRDPTRHLLHPLFFGTLNRPAESRSRLTRSFGAIPFLNGGLFEPHAIERRHRLRLPVEYWRDAFAALVDRVDVTLDAGACDGRVTPELLGRVFEGVMRPSERKAHGTFFTPPALVDAMVRASLASHLAARLDRSEDAIDRALDDPDHHLRRTLLDVTVFDPAVGSGAFLVGALALLHGPGPRHPARVRHLVTRRLFGVDRHPGAVRLCELRLWLEVLRSMRGRPAHRVPPLPNLDANVRAGDALIDPLRHAAVTSAAARRIAAHQRAIRGAHGAAKRAAVAEAGRSEHQAMTDALADRESSAQREIARWLVAARAPTLFGERPPFTARQRRELAEMRRALSAVRQERRRLARDATSAPFAIDAAFAPVLVQRHGFDLVLGNPPWVRAERLDARTRQALASRYRWWRSGGTGWRHLPDLAVAFVERGFELLAPGGTLGLLVPAKLATAGYAVTCRGALTSRATIHCVADLADDPRAGFEATTYPLAMIVSRRAPAPGHRVRLGLACDAPVQAQSQWPAGGMWLTAPPDVQRIALRLARDFPSLREQFRPQLGVKTGANTAFIDPPAELRRWCRRAVRGRDVRPFTAAPGAWILWPADEHGVPWAVLPPAVARYLDSRVAMLQRRADQQRGPWWQLFRTRPATAPHRVIWRDLAPALQAAVLWDRDLVPLNSCYVAAVRSAAIAESLAAWLNSTWIRVLARMMAEPAAGGCARFAARVVGAIPLPAAVPGHPVLASLAHAAADHAVQSPLDECAADLLHLSRAERDTLHAVAAHRR